MQEEPYQLDAQGQIYLVHNGKKFWHLIADLINNITKSRAGPLNSDGLEIEAKCEEAKPKTHKDLTTCLGYAEHHIKLKQDKGYQKGTRKGFDVKRPALSEFQLPFDKRIKPDHNIEHSVHSVSTADSFNSRSANQSFSSSLPSFQSSLNSGDFFNYSQSQEHSSYPPTTRGYPTGMTETSAIVLEDDKNNSGKQRRVPRTFVGSYLVRKNKDQEEFYKIQVLRKHLKIEEGITGAVKMTPQYQTYKNKEEAVNQANNLMIKKIEEGFEIQDSRFKFDFENNEALIIKRALKKQKNLQASSQDAQEETGEPIITQQQENFQVPNEEFQKKLKQIEVPPPLGLPMFNAFENLGEPTEWQDENPTGWYMFERLGGIRCVWDGFEFQSKLGNRYKPPPFFVQDFPQSPLDGMLYAGKRKIRACQDILKSKGASLNQWSKAQFYVYDAMRVEGTFEERFAKLKKEFSTKTSSFIKLCSYEKCQSMEHFNKEFQRIKDEHGEGIVLKNPTSYYTRGTCKGYLEARAQYENIGTVVGVIKKEKASAQDPIKSLEVEDSKGNRFAICRGITQDVKDNPPEVGSRISYRYSGEIAEGKPKAPILIRILKPDEKIPKIKEKKEEISTMASEMGSLSVSFNP